MLKVLGSAGALTDAAAEAGYKQSLHAGQARTAPQHASTLSSAQYHLRADPVTGLQHMSGLQASAHLQQAPGSAFRIVFFTRVHRLCLEEFNQNRGCKSADFSGGGMGRLAQQHCRA